MVQVLEAIVGLQFGDEGKGKIVDERVMFAQSHNHKKRVVVVRFNGGANAGHTSYIPRQDGTLAKLVTHAAPSGLASNADIAIGPHVAFDPVKFMRELKEAREVFGYDARVMISERTGILFDYHIRLDAWREDVKKKKTGDNIGTTRSGIGPFYEDNSRRSTRITFYDYVSDHFPDKLREVLELKKPELKAAKIWRRRYADELVSVHDTIRKELKPFAERLEYRLNDYLMNKDHIIIEGANGTYLDVDMGTLGNNSSSHLLAPNAFASLGLPRKAFKVYGVEKVYPTRVGSGVMPTFEGDVFSEFIDQNAGEFGATTGRRRRAGYPDWVLVKRAVMLNDCDGIFMTRADVVQEQAIKVCIGYYLVGGGSEKHIREVPLDLGSVIPVYDGRIYNWHIWPGPKDLSEPEAVNAELRAIRSGYVEKGFDMLPRELLSFVKKHDEYVGCPTIGISIGPARGETVMR